jgi:DNA-binding transcriptional LysR family regulator
MNISIDMLHAFVTVAESGSVSAAATALGVPKSVASKRLAQLESLAHATLVSRSSRKLALTPAGELYLPFARRAIGSLSEADDGLRALRAVPSGAIRITAPVSWGQRALAKVIPEFLASHPEIEIELILQDRLLDIDQEHIDVALRMSSVATPDWVWLPIARLDWVICATPYYLATHSAPLEPDDLATHACMNYWSMQSDDAWHLRKGDTDIRLRVRNRYRANNPEAVLDAAMAGLGVALLPRYCCEGELRDGTLLPVLADWQPITKYGKAIFAVAAPDRMRLSRIQALLTFLKEHFEPPRPAGAALRGASQGG